MATYVYKAKKNTAETVTGEVQARSQEEAIDLIHDLGLLPVAIEVESDEKRLSKFASGKVSGKEIYVFSRQIANMIKSGIPLLRALTIIQEQTGQPFFKKVIGQIISDVKNGSSFSQALTRYPNIFSSLYVTMVLAGEESGRLYEMLVNISNYQQKQQETASKVRMALIYPVLMIFVGLITIYVILTFVVPKLSGLFASLGNDLPLPTVLLLNISSVLNKGWLVIVFLVAGTILFFNRWRKTPSGRLTLSYYVMRLPLFGEILLKSELARFSRTMDLLLKSGVPILKALKISTLLLNNEIIKNHFVKCSDILTSGGLLGTALKQSSDIPPIMGHLIAIGEESGNLSDVLSEIALTYEQESDEKIKIVTTLLEPMMILVVGLVIGFIVFALLLPIFQIDMLAH